jgi:o-succinylbenzoate synthase
VATSPLLPVDGMLAVTRPDPDDDALRRLAAAEDRVDHWRRRLAAVGQDQPA